MFSYIIRNVTPIAITFVISGKKNKYHCSCSCNAHLYEECAHSKLRKSRMIRFSGKGYLKTSFCNRVQSELIKRDVAP